MCNLSCFVIMSTIRLCVKLSSFNVTMVVNLLTMPFKNCLLLKASNFVFHALRRLNKMESLKARYTLLTTLSELFSSRLTYLHIFGKPLIWATYLLNILPSSIIANYVPQTCLFGTKMDYTTLRIFGCLFYPHVYANNKLEPRATPSIFLGYPSNHHGYRCLNLNTNNIILFKHVTFDETISHLGRWCPPYHPPTLFWTLLT